MGRVAKIPGRKTAIDVLAMAEHGQTSYLVLQHASAGPFFGSPGQVLKFDSPTGAPGVLAACLPRPTSMTLDRKRGILYVSEFGGRIVKITVASDTAFAPTVRSISSRGRVESGDNVMIGEGTSGGRAEVVMRAIGPSLSMSSVANPLQDPILTLHDAAGHEVARNDDWKGDAGRHHSRRKSKRSVLRRQTLPSQRFSPGSRPATTPRSCAAKATTRAWHWCRSIRSSSAAE